MADRVFFNRKPRAQFSAVLKPEVMVALRRWTQEVRRIRSSGQGWIDGSVVKSMYCPCREANTHNGQHTTTGNCNSKDSDAFCLLRHSYTRAQTATHAYSKHK